MPTTCRAFVKASIIYLCLGAILGALLLINRWLPLGAKIAALRGSHVEMLVTGWLTQLIMGVAWWLFPPLAIRLRPDAPWPVRSGQRQRGSEALLWATFVCLNAGVLLRAIFEPLYSWTQRDFYGFLAGSSGTLVAAAAVLFMMNLWGRVRELGQRKARSDVRK
jgi:hypothetical protein